MTAPAITIDPPRKMTHPDQPDQLRADGAQFAAIRRGSEQVGQAVIAPRGLTMTNLFVRYEDSRGEVHRSDMNAFIEDWPERAVKFCKAREVEAVT